MGRMRLQASEQQGWQIREVCVRSSLESVRTGRSSTGYPKVALHNLCEAAWGCSEAVTRWRQVLTVSLSVSDAEGTWKVICLLTFSLCSFAAGKCDFFLAWFVDKQVQIWVQQSHSFPSELIMNSVQIFNKGRLKKKKCLLTSLPFPRIIGQHSLQKVYQWPQNRSAPGQSCKDEINLHSLSGQEACSAAWLFSRRNDFSYIPSEPLDLHSAHCLLPSH